MKIKYLALAIGLVAGLSGCYERKQEVETNAVGTDVYYTGNLINLSRQNVEGVDCVVAAAAFQRGGVALSCNFSEAREPTASLPSGATTKE